MYATDWYVIQVKLYITIYSNELCNIRLNCLTERAAGITSYSSKDVKKSP